MEGIDAWSLMAGIVMTLGGLVLTVVGFFILPFLIYGVVILVIGIVILFTLKKQEYIEPIRKERNKKSAGVRKR